MPKRCIRGWRLCLLLLDYKNPLREAYDDRAEVYDVGNRSYTDSYLADVIGQLMYELRRPGGSPRVLDLGCGPGHDAMRMARHGLDVTGVDLSEGMVRQARKKGVRAEVMDYGALAFPPASFDGVWAARSLQHMPKAELPAVLASVRQLLRPGGRFYMVVYEGTGEGPLASEMYPAERYFAFYQPGELRAALLEAGLHVYREWQRRLPRRPRKEVLLAFATAVP